MTPYPEETVETMRKFYNTLNEKDKRRYAATEAMKLGHGGVSYIAQCLRCARSTIFIGIGEMNSLPNDCQQEERIRKPGAGRKPYDAHIPNIDDAFLDVIENHTAGSPMSDCVRWTNLTQAQIAQRLCDDHGICVSETVIVQLLKKHNFKKRKAQKKKP